MTRVVTGKAVPVRCCIALSAPRLRVFFFSFRTAFRMNGIRLT